MGKRHAPRKGSMQFWPHKRSKRIYPRVNARVIVSDVKPLEFSGYKAGMTHVIIKDNGKTSLTKNMNVSVPVTIIECPDLHIYGVRFIQNKEYGTQVLKDILVPKVDKILSRRLSLSKKKNSDFVGELDSLLKENEISDIRLLVYTMPKETGVGKKKPDVFELALGGKVDEKLNYIKENFEKPIVAKDVFKEGEFIDVHGVTKGRGFQGAVKRYGVNIRARKSEKTKRGAGSLGGWKAQGHVMYRIPAAGKMGFNTRVDYNKKIVSISNDLEKVNPAGGFVNYGFVKSNYMLVKGSIPGPKKRMVRLVSSVRLKDNKDKSAFQVTKVVNESPQGC